MISFIRFLHSTTAVLSKESTSINEIFSALLRTPKLPSSREQLWSMILEIGEKFVKSFSVVCNNDLRVVQDCLKCLVNCLHKDSKSEETEREDGECK